MLKPRLKKQYTSDFEVSGKRWNQNRLTAKLQLAEWDTSQGSLSRLENGERRVPDLELFVLADVLGAKLEDFFPKNLRGKVKASGHSIASNFRAVNFRQSSKTASR